MQFNNFLYFILFVFSTNQFCCSFAPNMIITSDKLKQIDQLIHEALQILSEEKGRHDESVVVPITKQITTISPTTTPPTTPIPTTIKIQYKPTDCGDVKKNVASKSGIYEVQPLNKKTQPVSFQVFCDMETDGGGWTVFQRRGNYGHPKEYFYKNWKSYSEGFGHMNQDFWLGNDKIHSLTNQGNYALRIDLKNVHGISRYAHYKSFRILSENESYKLQVSGYSGNAGESLYFHNNVMFSTYDRDNDGASDFDCAKSYKGGWWYNSSFCYYTNLNGYYATNSWLGVNWYTFGGWDTSLAFVEMKIRRVS